jgi:hypothetical protein
VAQNPNLDEAQNELQFFVRDLVHNSFFNKPESSESTGRIMANVLSCRQKMPGTVEPRNGHKYRPPLWANQRNKQKWMKQTIGNHLVL